MRVNGWLASSVLSLGMVAATTAPAVAAGYSPAGCVAAGDTGLNAVMSASSGQHIHGTIDASACNLGIFIDRSARCRGVACDHHGFQGPRDLRRERDPREYCAQRPQGDCGGPEQQHRRGQGDRVVGTSNSTVGWNLVTDTVGSGGIGLSDNGPLDAGAPQPGILAPRRPQSRGGQPRAQQRHGLRDRARGIRRRQRRRPSQLGGGERRPAQRRGNRRGCGPAQHCGERQLGGRQPDQVQLHPGGDHPQQRAGRRCVAHLCRAERAGRQWRRHRSDGGNGPTDPTAIILAGEVETITATRIQSNAIRSNEHFGIWIGNSSGEILRGLRLDQAQVPLYYYAP